MYASISIDVENNRQTDKQTDRQTDRQTDVHFVLFTVSPLFSSNGTLRTTVNVPDSITNWILQGMSLSSSGFGVAKPKTIQANKSFFIECRMPFSARRLEKISIVCFAYNFNRDELYVRYVLLGHRSII